MKLIQDEQGNLHLANDQDVKFICPFKAPITIQVKQKGGLLGVNNDTPQLIQSMQTCNSLCPLFRIDKKEAKYIKYKYENSFVVSLHCSHGAIYEISENE